MQDLQDALKRLNDALDWLGARDQIKQILDIVLGLNPGLPIPFPWPWPSNESTPADPGAYIDAMTETQVNAYRSNLSTWAQTNASDLDVRP